MKNIKKILEEKISQSSFSGIISIFNDNKVVYEKVCGYRDICNKIPIDRSTKFGIASGTKTITALAIGILIQENKLNFDTKVSEISEEFSGFIDSNATVKDLLSHKSGTFDYLDESIIEDYENYSLEIPWFKLETPSDYLPMFKGKIQKFKAGEDFSYSNGGYLLLGIIIERITKMLYRDFVKTRILEPLDMKNSGFYAFNDLPENTAYGYCEDEHTTNIYILPIIGASDGGMYTTSNDLLKLWNGIFENKIINKELIDIFLKAHHRWNKLSAYGLGFYVDKIKSKDSFIMVGEDTGVGFESRYFPKEKVLFNIMTNKTDVIDFALDIIKDNLEELF